MYSYLAVITAFLGYILYKCYIYPLYLSPLRKIPGPPDGGLLIGHYATFLNKEPDEAFVRFIKRYGGIVRYHGLLNRPFLLISDPKLIQQILVNRNYDYHKFFNRSLAREFLGNGLLLAEGDSHKRQRKMMYPSFAFANVKEMVPTFVEAGHQLKDLWMKQIGNKKEEKITITSLIPKITLDVIGLVGFNYEFNAATSSKSELAQAYKIITGRDPSPLYMALTDLFPIIRKIPIPYNNEFYVARNFIVEISEELVAKKKDNPILGKDLLSLLVKSNENLPIDEQLTHEEMVSQVMTLLIAGHETTSTSLSWALYFLAKNPDIQDHLRKECLDVLKDRNHKPTFDEIEQLKYLECVFKETLRMVPPVPGLIRCTTKDEIMNGYVIPKGTPMMIPINAIHHNPLVWGEDAEEFNPSRWLDEEIKPKITTSTFLPFSQGPKNCLGIKMAHLELKSILSVLIRNFEFNIEKGYTVQKKRGGLSKPIPGVDLFVSKLEY